MEKIKDSHHGVPEVFGDIVGDVQEFTFSGCDKKETCHRLETENKQTIVKHGNKRIDETL